MSKVYWMLLACWTIQLTVGTAFAQDISSAGKRLAKELDAMDVEHLWLAKHYVNWETGAALDKPVKDGKPHTHCSAFVASASKRLGVYILRPPEHKTVLLANAQYEWLKDKGAEYGWKLVIGPLEAQRLANEGYLVIASFKEKDANRAGHIAIVRPSVRARQALEQDGPEIIQAGMTNYNRTTLKIGFKEHPAAWRDRQVVYYAHAR
jgi:hypothetical protein